MKPLSPPLLPMPSEEDDVRYRQLLRSWATYTGLKENDPYIQITAHIYGLCVQVNQHEATTSSILNRLDDRLNEIDRRLAQIEAQSNPTGEIDPNILQILGEISDKLNSAQEHPFLKTVKDPSYDLHKGHILMILRALRILVAMVEKLTKTTNMVPPVGSVEQDLSVETKDLNNTIVATGYRFKPFSRGKKILDWVKFACHDVDGKWLLKWGALVIALPATGFAVGLGQNYAQANHWFAKPVPQQSKVNP
jgi:hypothetical protein